MHINKVIEIVREAGDMFNERVFKVEQKTTLSDRVTTMDIKIEKLLKEKLMALLPESAFMGEESEQESVDTDYHKGYVWVVDPIDGTTNFVRDLQQSCVSVALLKDYEAVMGVVYNPYKKEMFYAEKGKGAYLNGEKIHVSNQPFESGMFFTSMALYAKEMSETCLHVLEEVYAECDDFRRFGSAAIELCLLACGRGDLYFEIRLLPWDYAAGVLILQEAGGHASIPQQNFMSYDVPVPVVAANTEENFYKLTEIVERNMDLYYRRPEWKERNDLPF